MDLQIAKLVAFAIYTEADTGIMGVSPLVLINKWILLDLCQNVEGIEMELPIDLHWKWENYCSIWGDEIKEAPKSPEDNKVEITEKGELALSPSKGAALPHTITLTEKGEAAAQAAELEIKAEAEAAQQPIDKPPAAKRGSKKGR